MKSGVRQCPLIDGVGRKVWTFVLGPSSGPQQMLMKPESDGRDGISAAICISTVDNKTYLIYFDQERRTGDHDKATYIFLWLSNNGTACDFSVENEFPNIIHLFTM